MKQFIKHNNTSFQDPLEKELKGLSLLNENLKDNEYLNIPKIIDINQNSLTIQKIDSHSASVELSSILGIGLGKLHKKVFDLYGLNEDNYIGLNPQKNILSKNWGEFFINYRLLYQIELILDSRLKDQFKNILVKNRNRLEEFLNNNCTHPSLVHGDLWSGNVLYDKSRVWLIDPAVYFGDREVDIAMSEMFGGFSKEFYTSYNKEYPLSSLYEQKKIIYNLYHYLNHYNLFGSGYLSSCKSGFEFIEGL